jgi:hypothetical protein
MPVLDESDSEARALVAVVTQPTELALIRREGWYRIPLARAPRDLAAEWLALYQTGAFGSEGRSIRWLAPITGIAIATRRELLPDQEYHPRAADQYYRVALGALQPLPVPLPSRRLRRVTFIATTLGQLLRARDVTDLWHPLEDELATADGVWGGGINRRQLPGWNVYT